MSDRRDRWKSISANLKAWTIPGVVEVNGPEDQADLQQFLDQNEGFRKALEDRIRGSSTAQENPVRSDTQQSIAQQMRARIEAAIATVNAPTIAGIDVQKATPPQHAAVSNAMRMSDAIARFKASKQASSENASRTLRDKGNLIDNLRAYLSDAHPEIGPDPFLHEIGTQHLSGFLDAPPSSRGRKTRVMGKAAPATLAKKISDLRSFFGYAQDELQATSVDPASGLGKRYKSLKSVAARMEKHYQPFNTSQLSRIFDPCAYLAFNRDADYFWAPLLSLHIGARLKEIVTLSLSSINQIGDSGIWCIDIVSEVAKNQNSIRRIPVPDQLINLGFIDYVEHMRKLKATKLFAHRDLDGPTLKNDPSKNASRHFGEYLDHLGLHEPTLVFHSFRHVVVTALQDAGVSLTDSMQIVGHQAQEFAMKSGQITSKQGRSSHLIYTHAEIPRLNVEDPVARLKGHLERCINVPLNYEQLRAAAVIVAEHTTVTENGFKSGWSKLRADYTAEQVARLSPLPRSLVT